MAYAEGNPKTKKLLKEWIASGKEGGIYNPSGLFPTKRNGREAVEGPHYPKPHSWYADCDIVDGLITKVR